MKKWLNPISFEGEIVKLEPLSPDHRDALIKAASDGKLWKLWYTSVPCEKTIDKFISNALEAQLKGMALPFIIINKTTEKVVGSTRYMNINADHRRLEIGHTWYSKSAQKTGINTETKYLLLQYAFEQLKCIAVEFRTHWHNYPSRNAIARLGAKQDGVLRNHRLHPDGSYRDTVVFSIINQEWPTVKKSLEFKMSRN